MANDTEVNLSAANNGTATDKRMYVFKPIETSTQLVLFILLMTVGIIGLVGNILVLCFSVKRKRTAKRLLWWSAFERNFKAHITSLAISDVLSILVSIPPVCVQLFFDLLQRGWGCKIARYLAIVFPSITMNNLLFISIEKYFSTRKVPRTFSYSTAIRMLMFAWIAGCLITLLPGATYDGVRYDLNETHYTVVCRYDNRVLPFRVMYLIFISLQYITPMVFMTKINISLIITLWQRMMRKVDVQRDNGIRMMGRAPTIRSTCIIIALSLAFIIPYFLYIVHIVYNNVTKATIDFETDIVIRAVSFLIAISNPAINFVLYFVQMKDFRTFLKRLFAARFAVENVNPSN